MDPGQFAEQMEHIAAGGFQTLTVSQLAAALADPTASMPERPLLITFDDGFQEWHSVALPILTRLGLASTAYIITGCLGGQSRWLASLGEGDRPMLSAGQVRDLDEAGVEIGAHGHRHVPLDELQFSDAVIDIDTSRARLEEIVGHRIMTFAYPYGSHTGSIKRHVETSGFEFRLRREARAQPSKRRSIRPRPGDRRLGCLDATPGLVDPWRGIADQLARRAPPDQGRAPQAPDAAGRIVSSPRRR